MKRLDLFAGQRRNFRIKGKREINEGFLHFIKRNEDESVAVDSFISLQRRDLARSLILFSESRKDYISEGLTDKAKETYY